MLHDDVRAELIKQFPAEVVEMKEDSGEAYYACPTCKRAVTVNAEKCPGCSQVLGWENVRKLEKAKGVRMASVEFEVPSDFSRGDCRKCPLSYIEKGQYVCPLNMRNHCGLKLS